ncbi:hypothetical protein ACS0TY_026325 [Phlomoides rotata]
MQGGELRKGALLARTNIHVHIHLQTFFHYHDKLTVLDSICLGRFIGKKSMMKDPPPLHFNISHTSYLVACGVIINSQIGIDVEGKHWRTKHNILSFARRYFSESEIQFLAGIFDQPTSSTNGVHQIMDTQGGICESTRIRLLRCTIQNLYHSL